jgi:hypothetical protein
MRSSTTLYGLEPDADVKRPRIRSKGQARSLRRRHEMAIAFLSQGIPVLYLKLQGEELHST